MLRLLAPFALLPEGWASDVLIEIDAAGRISGTAPHWKPRPKLVSDVKGRTSEATFAEGPFERAHGFVVPGMPNLHSHAFQRAMAGLAEARTDPSDSFWTWREIMYRFASRLMPDELGHLAAHLYVEMLKAGYTSVAEFHYLHRDSRGGPFDDPAEMSHRVIAAAGDAGIAITHLPTLYAHGGFGAKPHHDGQARFVLSGGEYEALVAALDEAYGDTPEVRIGAAFHSLRAVDPALMRKTLAALDGIDASCPIHIHIAEQQKEVEECLAWSGKRPVRWLLDNAPVDARWCLVHATHLDAGEIEGLARSGAVAGLCPITEANLGDGVFPAREYLADARARCGIGSDSHISVSVAEELRLLEYGQRLVSGQRAALATEAQPSPGQRMYEMAAAGGAQALGVKAGRIVPGCRADLVVLDPEHPALWNKTLRQVLDAWIFAGDGRCVRDVMVGGQWRIREGRHPREEEIAQRFRAAQAALIE